MQTTNNPIPSLENTTPNDEHADAIVVSADMNYDTSLPLGGSRILTGNNIPYDGNLYFNATGSSISPTLAFSSEQNGVVTNGADTTIRDLNINMLQTGNLAITNNAAIGNMTIDRISTNAPIQLGSTTGAYQTTNIQITNNTIDVQNYQSNSTNFLNGAVFLNLNATSDSSTNVSNNNININYNQSNPTTPLSGITVNTATDQSVTQGNNITIDGNHITTIHTSCHQCVRLWGD